MTKHLLLSLAMTVVASTFPARAAEAQTGACKVGARVVDRQNRTGVVTEARASDCRVKLDDGESRFYLAWMLTAAGNSSSSSVEKASSSGSANGADLASGLVAGRYQCWAASGVAGTMRLVIKNGSTYADSRGTTGEYTYDRTTGKIVFDSGPWGGYFGKKLGPKHIGISSRSGNFYGTTCELK